MRFHMEGMEITAANTASVLAFMLLYLRDELDAFSPILVERTEYELEKRINERVCNRVLEGVTPGVVFTGATVSAIRVNEDDRAAFVERYGWKRRKK